MSLNYKCHEQQYPDQKLSAATCLFKDNNYWLYHRYEIENTEEEKANPGDKLWLVMRHMGNDKDHDFEPGRGFKLDIGDTIKFGRVRYKVIMMHSEQQGVQEYNIADRFQKTKFRQNRKNSMILNGTEVKVKKRRKFNSQNNGELFGSSQAADAYPAGRAPSQASGRTAATAVGSSYQHQATNVDGHHVGGSWQDSGQYSSSSMSNSNSNVDGPSDSQQEQDQMDSSEYMTESEDQAPGIGPGLEPFDVDMDNLATVNNVEGSPEPAQQPNPDARS